MNTSSLKDAVITSVRCVAARKRLQLAEVYVHKVRKLSTLTPTDSNNEDDFEVFHIYECDESNLNGKIVPKLSTNLADPTTVIKVLEDFTGSDTPQLQRLIERFRSQNEGRLDAHITEIDDLVSSDSTLSDIETEANINTLVTPPISIPTTALPPAQSTPMIRISPSATQISNTTTTLPSNALPPAANDSPAQKTQMIRIRPSETQVSKTTTALPSNSLLISAKVSTAQKDPMIRVRPSVTPIWSTTIALPSNLLPTSANDSTAQKTQMIRIKPSSTQVSKTTTALPSNALPPAANDSPAQNTPMVRIRPSATKISNTTTALPSNALPPAANDSPAQNTQTIRISPSATHVSKTTTALPSNALLPAANDSLAQKTQMIRIRPSATQISNTTTTLPSNALPQAANDSTAPKTPLIRVRPLVSLQESIKPATVISNQTEKQPVGVVELDAANVQSKSIENDSTSINGEKLPVIRLTGNNQNMLTLKPANQLNPNFGQLFQQSNKTVRLRPLKVISKVIPELPLTPPGKLWNHHIRQSKTPDSIDLVVVSSRSKSDDDNSTFRLKPSDQLIENNSNGGSSLQIGQVFECVNDDFVENLLIEKPATHPDESPSPLLDSLVEEVTSEEASTKNIEASKPNNIIMATKLIWNSDCGDFRCYNCLESNKTLSIYKQHMDIQHKLEFVCGACHGGFVDAISFAYHSKSSCESNKRIIRKFISIVDAPIVLKYEGKVEDSNVNYVHMHSITIRITLSMRNVIPQCSDVKFVLI